MSGIATTRPEPSYASGVWDAPVFGDNLDRTVAGKVRKVAMREQSLGRADSGAT
ncbi:hypothetical protein [Rhodococcus sp. Q]|uniref:hypothetical protein n=1 Tax=Rhodococcus sp. Q TaxID=2502252 RepID=UPI001484E86A|nr:hypothetical protein [Rhodococcus sp. Q]